MKRTISPIDPEATCLVEKKDDSRQEDEQGHQLAYPLKKKTSELVDDNEDEDDDDFNDDNNNNVELVHLVEEGFHNDDPPSSISRIQRVKKILQQQNSLAEQLIDLWRHYSILIISSIVFIISIVIIITILCNNNNNNNNNISRIFQKALHYILLQLTSDFIINFLAGGISGSLAKTCTAPIERVKLLIQTQDVNPKVISGEVIPYLGIIDCFKRVTKEQGVTSLWRGNVANIIRYFPTQAFNFAFKDSIKGLFPVVDKETQFGKFFLVNMASGGLAGAGSLCFVYPLDYARTRLASDVGENNQQFNGLWDCLQQTFATGGIRGIYNGLGISIMGIIPYRGMYFGLFDTLSGINPYETASSNVVRATSKFVCAQTSAICAAYISYPFDTVRRRLQMQSELTEDQCVYDGTVDCFVKIVKGEGPCALFKGAGANALRTVGAALVLVLYSEITAAISG